MRSVSPSCFSTTTFPTPAENACRLWPGPHIQTLAEFEKIRVVGKGAYGSAVLYRKVRMLLWADWFGLVCGACRGISAR